MNYGNWYVFPSDVAYSPIVSLLCSQTVYDDEDAKLNHGSICNNTTKALEERKKWEKN